MPAKNKVGVSVQLDDDELAALRAIPEASDGARLRRLIRERLVREHLEQRLLDQIGARVESLIQTHDAHIHELLRTLNDHLKQHHEQMLESRGRA